MKLKRLIAMLTMAIVGFCSAEEQSICAYQKLVFTIKDPVNYSANIKLFGSDSRVISEYNLKRELHPSAKIKKVMIDFSSNVKNMENLSLNVINIKDLSRNEFHKVISTKNKNIGKINNEENPPLNYEITLTHIKDGTIITDTKQCNSGLTNKQSSFFQDFIFSFLKDYNDFQLNKEELSNMVQKNIDQRDEDKLTLQILDQEMHSIGYITDSFGNYVEVNSTSASY